MADLLRQGATLTELACPACASPLFKLKSGDLWCEHCNKKVILLKEGESPDEIIKTELLSKVEATLLTKIQEIEKQIREETNPEKLQKLTNTLEALLSNLEKTRKIKR
jgi:UPF0148 protein